MAWQWRTAWIPVQESKAGARLPELSGLFRRRKEERKVAVTVTISVTPIAHWQSLRVAS